MVSHHRPHNENMGHLNKDMGTDHAHKEWHITNNKPSRHGHRSHTSRMAHNQ